MYLYLQNHGSRNCKNYLINAALTTKNHLINAALAAPSRRIFKKKFSTTKGLPLFFFLLKIAMA